VFTTDAERTSNAALCKFIRLSTQPKSYLILRNEFSSFLFFHVRRTPRHRRPFPSSFYTRTNNKYTRLRNFTEPLCVSTCSMVGFSL
jgi:hypothetical protein